MVLGEVSLRWGVGGTERSPAFVMRPDRPLNRFHTRVASNPPLVSPLEGGRD